LQPTRVLNRPGSTGSSSTRKAAVVQYPASAQTNLNRSQFSKNVAATKLAAAFRGKLARDRVAQVMRQNQAISKQKIEEELEANRPKPKQLIRPKGRSYIGF
jgi:hypothetical protein